MRLKQRKQLNARRGAEHALVEAQNKIAQMDQALQQGERPMVSVGQLVDTRVGRQEESVMKASAGAIDQQLSTDMTSAEISTDVTSNESMTCRKQSKSVQWYFVLIVLCTGRALGRIANAPHGWGMEAWRMLFQANSPKLEMWAFPLDTNDVVKSLETMERKIEMGIVSRQAEEGQNAVMAKTGDAMDADAFSKGSSKSASKSDRKGKEEVVFWY